MYAGADKLDELKPAALDFIMDNDRMLYQPFITAAEKFCSENSVLVGGKVGIDLLVGAPKTIDSFYYELYCDDAFATAKALADTLSRIKSPHVSPRTVALKTEIKHREFTLTVNTRYLFKIYAMDKYRGMNLINIMRPDTRMSYSGFPIGCLSAEMQLIDVYRTLYSPSRLARWENDYKSENTLFGLVSEEDKTGDTIAKAGATIAKAGAADFNRHESDNRILSWLKDTDNVLVGDYALSALDLEQRPSRIQFISSDDIEKINGELSKLLSRQANNGRKVGIQSIRTTYARFNLNIPSDFQIAKYTIYAVMGNEQVSIADVFNSTQFEMIPYSVVNRVKVGNPWVILRFQFIDIWVLKLISGISAENKFSGSIRNIINRAARLRNKMSMDWFQIDNYVGASINETVSKKKLIKELGGMFPIYYPAKAEIQDAV